MLIQDIDVIGLQSPQRSFDGLTNVFRATVDACNRTVPVEREAELGGNRHARTAAGQRTHSTSEELLVRIGAVCLCGIKKCATQFNGPMDRRDRLRLFALLRLAVGE